MKKENKFFLLAGLSFVFFLASVLFPSEAEANLSDNGYYSTSFDCASDWSMETRTNPPCFTTAYPGLNTNVNGIYDAILKSANRPGSTGSAAVHYNSIALSNSNGGGFYVVPEGSPNELWIRYYVSFEKNAKHNGMKMLYVYFSGGGGDYFSFPDSCLSCSPSFSDGLKFYEQTGGMKIFGAGNIGFNSTYPGGLSDGSWRVWEYYLKLETTTNPANGIIRFWQDGQLLIERLDVNFNNANSAGIDHFLLGSNGDKGGVDSNGDGAFATYYDDFAMATSSYGNFRVDSHGNRMIGFSGTALSFCGDGTCQSDETCAVCAADCGICPANILLQEGFNDNNFSSRGWFDSTTMALDTSVKKAGASAARFAWAPGATKPTGVSTLRHDIAPTDSLYVSFYWRFNSDWVGSGKSYHPHLLYVLSNKDNRWGALARNYLDTYIETSNLRPNISIQDGLNINTVPTPPWSSTNGTEKRSVAGCNGLTSGADGGDARSCYQASGVWMNGLGWYGGINFSKNVWHHVENYFKMNSILDGQAKADGEMKMWIDGVPAIAKNNIVYRTGINPDLKWATFIIAPYMGDGSPQSQTMWMDELIVGNANPRYSDEMRPRPPTGISIR